MHLTLSEVNNLTEASLREFVGRGIPEGVFLDYKASLPLLHDKEGKRELLKDISGFANAVGGMLLFGVCEPSSGSTIDSQLVGLESAPSLAQQVEHLAASSINPRISGLLVKVVPLANAKFCLIVYVPPSRTRPHMVVTGNHRSFYMRHSESTQPMDTHEVREAVLATATAEARVNKRLADRNDWAKRRFVGVHLFLQAVPLVAPPTNWEVLSQGFSEIVRGNHRRNLPDLKYFDLSSQYSPVPTIEGVHGGVRSGDPNRWRLDVFRDGYISLCVENTQTYSVGGHLNPREVYALDQEWGEVFLAFAKVINECIRYTGSDLPYAIAAVYRSAQLTCLCVGRNNFVGPYEEDEILWPNHIRNVGEDAEIIAKQQLVEMFHAYGRQLPGAS